MTAEVARLLGALHGEMRRDELMAALGLNDRKHFQSRYQQPAIAAGLIEMTLPVGQAKEPSAALPPDGGREGAAESGGKDVTNVAVMPVVSGHGDREGHDVHSGSGVTMRILGASILATPGRWPESAARSGGPNGPPSIAAGAPARLAAPHARDPRRGAPWANVGALVALVVESEIARLARRLQFGPRQ